MSLIVIVVIVIIKTFNMTLIDSAFHTQSKSGLIGSKNYIYTIFEAPFKHTVDMFCLFP